MVETKRKSGWHVSVAAKSTTGGLHVTGTNYETEQPEAFRWTIGHYSLTPGNRYDFSSCTFDDGAYERFQQLVEMGAAHAKCA